MANNYSTFGFWRSWHRSFNLWIVRYIYVPLGGTKNVIYTSVFIFTFVALWHDLSFRLLAWGWLVSFFFIPELAARILLPASNVLWGSQVVPTRVRAGCRVQHFDDVICESRRLRYWHRRNIVHACSADGKLGRDSLPPCGVLLPFRCFPGDVRISRGRDACRSL